MRTLLKLSWVELKLFFREPTTMVFTLALPLMMLYVMGGVFGNEVEEGFYRGVGAMNYYIGAYIGLVISSIGVISLPVHLTAYRERGVLRRLRASSISIWAILGSQVTVSFFLCILGGILMILTAVFGYGINAAQAIPQVILAFFIATLSFSAIGFLLGSLFPTTRAAQGIGIILFFLMLMIGGAGPPPEVLPDTLRVIGEVLPIHWVILLIQDPWLGFGWNTTAMLLTVGYLVVTAALAVRFFRWE
ncbi:MAG: ABC transporter permease [Dehalococcoidales bacterium]|nr:ABC transporter permease [Dehalococcoidales bacterium]